MPFDSLVHLLASKVLQTVRTKHCGASAAAIQRRPHFGPKRAPCPLTGRCTPIEQNKSLPLGTAVRSAQWLTRNVSTVSHVRYEGQSAETPLNTAEEPSTGVSSCEDGDPHSHQGIHTDAVKQPKFDRSMTEARPNTEERVVVQDVHGSGVYDKHIPGDSNCLEASRPLMFNYGTRRSEMALRRARRANRRYDRRPDHRTARARQLSLTMRWANTQDLPEDGEEELGNELSWYSSVWTKATAQLNARHDPRVVEGLRKYPFGLHPDTPMWFEQITSQGWNRTSLREQWIGFMARYPYPYLVNHRWMNVMLYIMFSSPEHSLEFLEATYIEPHPYLYAVVDVLEHAILYGIRRSSLAADISAQTNHVQDVLNALHRLSKSGPIPHLSQKTLYYMIEHCNLEQLKAFHNVLMDGQVPSHFNTLLHLAEQYGTLGCYERALLSLRDAVNRGAAVDSKPVLSTACLILRRSAAEDSGYQAGAELIAEFLEMGIQPNIYIYNSLMLNAVEADDLNTAFRVYDLLHEMGSCGSAYTYAIMLKACKSCDDPDLLAKILRDAEGSGVLGNNTVALTEMLHCVYILHKRRGSIEQGADLMRQAYCKYFQKEVLVKLQLAESADQDGNSSFEADGALNLSAERLKPDPPTIFIVLLAFVETCTSVPKLVQTYVAFRKQVYARDPLFARMAETDHVYNMFIKAFGRNKTTLHLCTQVLKEMTTPLPGSPNVLPDAASGSGFVRPTFIPAPPTVQTWTILLQAFIYHGQSAAAEKVLKLMQARNLKPNDITWNILAAGYAALQDVDGVVKTMGKMEEKGFKLGTKTLEQLGRMRDRRGLSERLRTAAVERERISGSGTIMPGDE